MGLVAYRIPGLSAWNNNGPRVKSQRQSSDLAGSTIRVCPIALRSWFKGPDRPPFARKSNSDKSWTLNYFSPLSPRFPEGFWLSKDSESRRVFQIWLETGTFNVSCPFPLGFDEECKEKRLWKGWYDRTFIVGLYLNVREGLARWCSSEFGLLSPAYFNIV